ncbi:type 1 glutamine amidotransferase domain-containing protein [Pseudogulbenkiania subflava]|uniref:Putative intracellular protease/amidase n=1 Tax=Pseudogulbenkiania subflava DSM 22618 TaxID=1123014 RepID=A0A1Y6BE19_9NEIS|nr:type 1 glutamine amidotransferase domain-containing protein [Pseudogulbenkiania subflava]SME99127.1 Putative intracellular protease/amidase [Pseudogulbenkiania subflava DSM 22618]
MSKVLFVLTSHDQLGDTGHKTGFWIEEFAAPYYALVDHGVSVTLASPKGGQPPIDPKSALPESQTPATARFNADAALQAKLAATLRLDAVRADDFDAVFYPGGHGPLWDLANDGTSQALITAFLAQAKPVAAVCHAPAVLLGALTPEGLPVVAGRRVSGFSNSEEQAVGLADVVPFLLEDALQAKGGQYQRGPDWQSFAVEDGLLITGQNPASSEAVAEALLRRLPH